MVWVVGRGMALEVRKGAMAGAVGVEDNGLEGCTRDTDLGGGMQRGHDFGGWGHA